MLRRRTKHSVNPSNPISSIESLKPESAFRVSKVQFRHPILKLKAKVNLKLKLKVKFQLKAPMVEVKATFRSHALTDAAKVTQRPKRKKRTNGAVCKRRERRLNQIIGKLLPLDLIGMGFTMNTGVFPS